MTESQRQTSGSIFGGESPKESGPKRGPNVSEVSNLKPSANLSVLNRRNEGAFVEFPASYSNPLLAFGDDRSRPPVILHFQLETYPDHFGNGHFPLSISVYSNAHTSGEVDE